MIPQVPLDYKPFYSFPDFQPNYHACSFAALSILVSFSKIPENFRYNQIYPSIICHFCQHTMQLICALHLQFFLLTIQWKLCDTSHWFLHYSIIIPQLSATVLSATFANLRQKIEWGHTFLRYTVLHSEKNVIIRTWRHPL